MSTQDPSRARLSPPKRWLLTALLIGWSGLLQAVPARIEQAALHLRDAAYVLNASVALSLNERLRDAVDRGVALHFLTEVVISQPRWYWLDQIVVERVLEYRLSYHAITRSYRLSVGGLHQSFDSIDQAVAAMTRARNRRIIEADQLADGESYSVAVRFRLDPARLPRPFRVTELGSEDWRVDTGWFSWTFLAGGMGF